MHRGGIEERLDLLRQAIEDLNRIRREFSAEPDLLSFYEPSARYLVKSLLKEVADDFRQVFTAMAEVDTDVWVHLEGEGLSQGRAPIGLVGRFLQKLAVANQHAVSLIEEVQHTTGRFRRRIVELAQFELVAVAPGSVRLGLRGLDPSYFLDEEAVLQQPIEFPDGDATRGDKAHLAAAIAAAGRASEGIRLLTRAIIASEDSDELERLESDLGGRRNLLKLFHYAQSLTPSPRSEIRRIAIFGSAIHVPETRPVTATAVTRTRISETVSQLQKQQRFVEGIGFVRGIDLDRRIIWVRPFSRSDNEFHEEMECRFDSRTSESEIASLFEKAVSISGLLYLSTTNTPRYLEVDSWERVGPE